MIEEQSSSPSDSFHVAPGRATPVEVHEQAELCLDDPIIQAVLGALDCYAVILNPQRQVLAVNAALLRALKEEAPVACRGLRLGEVFGCSHVSEGPEGCGSSKACQHCGSLLAMLATQASGQMASGECLISRTQEGQWKSQEFAVRTKAITVVGQSLTLLTLRDIGAEKRRESLERIFIHDLMDSIQVMRGWTEVMQGAGADATVVAEQVLALAGQFTADVEAQHRLLQAECGELIPGFRAMGAEGILDMTVEALGTAASARVARFSTPPEAGLVRTDPAILCGILRDMVLNALEATPAGGQVQIWHEVRSGCPTFVVGNAGCMPPEAMDRVFQRSFSTKATRGRGLGTYSMKVLGEGVLGGKVGFTSNWEDGTRFFIALPREA